MENSSAPNTNGDGYKRVRFDPTVQEIQGQDTPKKKDAVVKTPKSYSCYLHYLPPFPFFMKNQIQYVHYYTKLKNPTQRSLISYRYFFIQI